MRGTITPCEFRPETILTDRYFYVDCQKRYGQETVKIGTAKGGHIVGWARQELEPTSNCLEEYTQSQWIADDEHDDGGAWEPPLNDSDRFWAAVAVLSDDLKNFNPYPITPAGAREFLARVRQCGRAWHLTEAKLLVVRELGAKGE